MVNRNRGCRRDKELARDRVHDDCHSRPDRLPRRRLGHGPSHDMGNGRRDLKPTGMSELCVRRSCFGAESLSTDRTVAGRSRPLRLLMSLKLRMRGASSPERLPPFSRRSRGWPARRCSTEGRKLNPLKAAERSCSARSRVWDFKTGYRPRSILSITTRTLDWRSWNRKVQTWLERANKIASRTAVRCILT